MNIHMKRSARGLAGIVVLLLTGPIDAIAASKVTIVPVPEGGQPVAAKIDAQGTIHLAFHAADGPRYAKSNDNGKTFTKSLPIVDRASRKPGLEFSAWDMTISPQGHVHVAMGTNAWKLKLPHEEWGFIYARLEARAKAFSAVQNINKKPSEGFSLAADERGNITACWLSDKLYANVSHDNGKTFGPTVQIDPALNPCDCCTTSADYGADGRLAVLYREETDNQRDMYLVLWDQEQNKVSRSRVSSTPWQIDSCPMTYYSIARHKDGFVAVWPTKGQIYFTRLDGKGELQSPAEIKTPGKSGMRTGVLTLSAADGSTLVAWKKDGQLGWQLYDLRGRASGPPGSARSAGSGAAGVLAKNGQFVLFR
jgi:hypothetical protein